MVNADMGKNAFTISRENVPSIVDAVEAELERVLCDPLSLGWGACRGTDPLPIQWVSSLTWSPPDLRDLLPKDAMQPALTPAFEVLGRYVSSHGAQRPGIELCAQNILDAAIRFQTHFRPDMATGDLFRLFTTATIIHELAHAMMDGVYNACDGLSTVFRRHHDKKPVAGLLNPPPLAPNLIPNLTNQDFGHVIEESLADAFILVQQFPREEMEILSAFIANGPVPYRYATGWQGRVLRAMQSWRTYKTIDAVATMEIVADKNKASTLPARLTAIELLAGRTVTADVDFHSVFEHHLAGSRTHNHAPSGDRTSTLHPDIPSDWREFLDEMEIRHWSVRLSGAEVLIDVDGDVDISGKGRSSIPVKFGTVNGNFDCSNNRFTSLDHFPKVVVGSIYCCNNEITSIKEIPCTSINGLVCLCGNEVEQCSIDILAVENLSAIHVNYNNDAFYILAQYLTRHDDLFECQARLIEKNLENFLPRSDYQDYSTRHR